MIFNIENLVNAEEIKFTRFLLMLIALLVPGLIIIYKFHPEMLLYNPYVLTLFVIMFSVPFILLGFASLDIYKFLGIKLETKSKERKEKSFTSIAIFISAISSFFTIYFITEVFGIQNSIWHLCIAFYIILQVPRISELYIKIKNKIKK